MAQTHGKWKTKEWNSWNHMRGRCNNPNNAKFHTYGGIGVAVCKRWGKFENFLEDMGLAPSPTHTIDRFPNKNGNYTKANCRWATQKEQQNNRTNNVVIKHNGLALTLSGWAAKLGVGRSTLCGRLRRGWSASRMLAIPPKVIIPDTTISTKTDFIFQPIK